MQVMIEISSWMGQSMIFRYSGGAARLVNKACTHCLIYGSQNGRRIIDGHMVKLVIQGEIA